MRIILPGGSGQVGQILARHLHSCGHQVIVLSRSPKNRNAVADSCTGMASLWTRSGPGISKPRTRSSISPAAPSTAATRRPTARRSSTPASSPRLLLGKAIAQCTTPPRVWMNASTSTFYRDARDSSQDEFTGEPCGSEPGVPETWNFSIDVARRWEEAFYASDLPRTRKIALRYLDDHVAGPWRRLLRARRPGALRTRRHAGPGRPVRLLDP